jgi:Domain of unknown function (DUF4328)
MGFRRGPINFSYHLLYLDKNNMTPLDDLDELRSNEQRAKNTIVMLSIVIVLEVVLLFSSYMQFSLLKDMAAGVDVSEEDANANERGRMILGLIYFLFYLGAAITFIQWFRRAYYNLHQLVYDLSESEGWAAGGWFIPVVSLYKPYQIMKELYERTKSLLVSKGIEVDNNFNSRHVGLWWGLWIFISLSGQLLWRYTSSANTLSEVTTSTMLHMILGIISVPSAFLAIKVVRDYSEVEHLLRQVKKDPESAHM